MLFRSQEIQGKPGYTAEGAVAASSTAVYSSGDTSRAVSTFGATMLHRMMLLGDAGFAVGFGSVSGGKGASTVLWGQDPVVGEGKPPLVVPAPGQRRVPLRGGVELPAPDDPPGWYEQPRGFPVSASLPATGMGKVEIQVTLGDGGAPLPGRLWIPEKPVTSGHGGMTAFFMPEFPLEQKQRYTVRLSGEAGGRPVVWTWSFRTD